MKETIKGVRIDEDVELTKINAEFKNTVNFSTFFNVLAEQNSLQLRVDANGFIVLQRMTTPAAKIISPENTEEADSVRTWTDVQGRSIEARLLQTDPSKATIEIERADGIHFTLPIARLSQADQQFIQKWQPEVDGTAKALPSSSESSAAALPSSSGSLAELSPAQWEWLAQAGSMTARKYLNAPAQQLVALLNTRLTGADSANMKEAIKGVRIDENAELTEINVVFDYTVSFSTFFKQLSEQNSLQLRVDPSGFIVLQRMPTSAGKIKFLGT